MRERAPWFALSESVRVDIRIRRGWYSEIGVSLLQPIVPDYFADFNDTKRVMSTQQKEDYLFRWRPMLFFPTSKRRTISKDI